MVSLAGFHWSTVPEQRRTHRDSRLPAKSKLAAKFLPNSTPKDFNAIKVPEECGLFTEKELDIISSDAEHILLKYKLKEWTVVEVTEAFIKSASVAQQLTNCLTEIFFEEALLRAQQLDEEFAKTGKLVGPFHGLPISIKDNFNVPGLPSSVGFVAFAIEPMTNESALVTILKGLGAVLYCKTNVPTAMMMAETDNHVWGETSNPFKRCLSSGGSSGGEAALIALRGSVMGVGTDIGGSIRIPGSFNHLYSLRPSFGRFPTYGCRSGMPGQEAINSVNGPMARTINTMKYYCTSVLAPGPYAPWNHDPRCLPIPYRPVALPSKLKFGLLIHDNVVRPHPPVERALALVSSTLQKAGHTVVPYSPGNLHVEGLQLLLRLFLADGGKHIADTLAAGEEEWFEAMDIYKQAASDPNHDLRTSAMWGLHLERTTWAKNYLEHWLASGIDALIMPATPYAAVQKGNMKYVGYTGVWNVLDYTAATFPVLFADKNLDVKVEDHKPLTELDETVWQSYDADVYDGAPVGLQLVCGKFEEEKCIAILEVLDDVLKFLKLGSV